MVHITFSTTKSLQSKRGVFRVLYFPWSSLPWQILFLSFKRIWSTCQSTLTRCTIQELPSLGLRTKSKTVTDSIFYLFVAWYTLEQGYSYVGDFGRALVIHMLLFSYTGSRKACAQAFPYEILARFLCVSGAGQHRLLTEHQDSSHKETCFLPQSYFTCKIRHACFRHVSPRATLWVDWHVNLHLSTDSFLQVQF